MFIVQATGASKSIFIFAKTIMMKKKFFFIMATADGSSPGLLYLFVINLLAIRKTSFGATGLES
jgi:hypothetical protein